MNALHQQVGGDHYRKLKLQPAEFIAANNWDFFMGNAFKYITRYRDKNGKQDLEKVIHYLNLRNVLFNRNELDIMVGLNETWDIEISQNRLNNKTVAWPSLLAEDFCTINDISQTDNRYKALLLLEELRQCASYLAYDLTRKLIEYIQFVIDTEYPDEPVDNSTKS